MKEPIGSTMAAPMSASWAAGAVPPVLLALFTSPIAALWVVVATALISAGDYYRRFSQVPEKVEQFPPVDQRQPKTSEPPSQFALRRP